MQTCFKLHTVVRSAWVVLLMALLPGMASAQNSNDGSVYSRFGLGQRHTFMSAKSQAMGGGGYALSSSLYPNPLNPASLPDQILTRFAGGLSYESITTSADGFTSGRLASGSLSGVHMTFPLLASRLGLGIFRASRQTRPYPPRRPSSTNSAAMGGFMSLPVAWGIDSAADSALEPGLP